MMSCRCAPAGPGVRSSAVVRGAPARVRIVRAIMLKGSTLGDLQVDTLWLTGLMLVAMTIAVTRFRRTLD